MSTGAGSNTNHHPPNEHRPYPPPPPFAAPGASFNPPHLPPSMTNSSSDTTPGRPSRFAAPMPPSTGVPPPPPPPHTYLPPGQPGVSHYPLPPAPLHRPPPPPSHPHIPGGASYPPPYPSSRPYPPPPLGHLPPPPAFSPASALPPPPPAPVPPQPHAHHPHPSQPVQPVSLPPPSLPAFCPAHSALHSLASSITSPAQPDALAVSPALATFSSGIYTILNTHGISTPSLHTPSPSPTSPPSPSPSSLASRLLALRPALAVAAYNTAAEYCPQLLLPDKSAFVTSRLTEHGRVRSGKQDAVDEGVNSGGAGSRKSDSLATMASESLCRDSLFTMQTVCAVLLHAVHTALLLTPLAHSKDTLASAMAAAGGAAGAGTSMGTGHASASGPDAGANAPVKAALAASYRVSVGDIFGGDDDGEGEEDAEAAAEELGAGTGASVGKGVRVERLSDGDGGSTAGASGRSGKGSNITTGTGASPALLLELLMVLHEMHIAAYKLATYMPGNYSRNPVAVPEIPFFSMVLSSPLLPPPSSSFLPLLPLTVAPSLLPVLSLLLLALATPLRPRVAHVLSLWAARPVFLPQDVLALVETARLAFGAEDAFPTAVLPDPDQLKVCAVTFAPVDTGAAPLSSSSSLCSPVSSISSSSSLSTPLSPASSLPAASTSTDPTSDAPLFPPLPLHGLASHLYTHAATHTPPFKPVHLPPSASLLAPVLARAYVAGVTADSQRRGRRVKPLRSLRSVLPCIRGIDSDSINNALICPASVTSSSASSSPSTPPATLTELQWLSGDADGLVPTYSTLHLAASVPARLLQLQREHERARDREGPSGGHRESQREWGRDGERERDYRGAPRDQNSDRGRGGGAERARDWRGQEGREKERDTQGSGVSTGLSPFAVPFIITKPTLPPADAAIPSHSGEGTAVATESSGETTGAIMGVDVAEMSVWYEEMKLEEQIAVLECECEELAAEE